MSSECVLWRHDTNCGKSCIAVTQATLPVAMLELMETVAVSWNVYIMTDTKK